MRDIEPPPWLDREAYPFRSKAFQLREGSLHYVDEGAGDPIVFVHGNPSWSFMYRQQILDLRAHHRCIAMDHLGFGLSDKPPGAGYRPQDHAERFRRFMDAVESEPVHLVVHDWGGPIAIAWALEHPGRVRSLVVLNTWFWSMRESKRARRFSGFMASSTGSFLVRRLGFFERFVMKMAFADKSKYRAAADQYRRPYSGPQDRAAVAEFPRQILAAGDWLDGLWQRRQVLADRPASIFWAMGDPAFRKDELDRWRWLLPEAKLEKIEGVGHYVAEEMGSDLSRLITRHVESLPPRGS